MPVGVQLSQLLTELRAEAGLSTNVATGINARDTHVALLNRAQRELASQRDWPHLDFWVDLPLTADTRYYAYPNGISFDDINYIAIPQGASKYVALAYGITPDAYAIRNSPAGETEKYPRAWQHRMNVDPAQNMIEMWPIPNMNQTAIIVGTHQIVPMVDASDVCMLDSDLIVLTVAAELLARQKAADAEIKIRKAQQLMRSLLSGQASQKREPFIMGGGAVPYSTKPERDFRTPKGT